MSFRILTTATATALLIGGAAAAQQVNNPLAEPVAVENNRTGFVTTGEEVMVDADSYLIDGQASTGVEQEILSITVFPADAEERLSDRY